MRIDCEFSEENHSLIGDVYACKARDLIITKKTDVVEGIDGEHMNGKTNNDVKIFEADDQTMRYLPAELENFFPNLQGIKVVKSGMKELTGENLKYLPNLEFCDFSSNEIESLDDENVFIFNSKLKEISFDENKIKFVSENIFEPLLDLTVLSFKNNECIDEKWEGENDINEGKIKLLKKCPPKLDFSIASGFEMGKNEGMKTEYQIGNTKVTTIRKISRLGSSHNGQWSVNFDSSESNDKTQEVTCDLGDSFWKFSAADFYTCTIGNQVIDFPGYKIKISSEEGAKVKALSFNDNKGIKFLPINLSEVFPNLVEISAKNTFLESLSGKVFEGLGKLKRITLANHDLKVIENENFAGLDELEELDLSEGNIRFIDEAGFSELKSLKSLNIGGNKLKFLQPKTFDGLSHLQNISLELNHLTDLDETLFVGNKKLMSVWLNGNKISVLSPATFDSLDELSHVDLTSNECIDGVFESSNFVEMKMLLQDNCSSSYVIRRTYKKVKVSSGGENIRSEFNIEGDEDESELSAINKITTQYFESSGVEVSEGFTTEGDLTVSEGEVTTTTTTISPQPTTQTLIIKNNPETKTVTCDFSEDVYWFYSDEKLKTCVIDSQMIDSKGFSILPTTQMKDVKAFSIANNNLVKFLPEKISNNFPKLLELSARNSSLSLLSRKSFEDLKHLKSLNLANNKIKFIESDTFDDLKELEELDLSSNEMEYIDESLFSKLKSLKTLRLSGNKLHFIHPKIFRDLRNLQNISLSSNQISTIDENIFKTNQNLKNIWLQNNKIKSMSPNMFDKPKQLEYIDLRENRCIDSVYEKSNFETMKTEVLGKCGEGYVLKSKQKKVEPKKKNKKEKVKTKKTEKFKEIGCDYDSTGNVFWPELNKTLYTCVLNEYEIIDGQNYKIFANTEPYQLPLIKDEDIQAISFVNNKNIKFLPVNIGESFPNLIAMKASGNSIANITRETFMNLPKLKFLNLSFNKIKSLNPDTFEYLTGLENLNLENNEIEEIEETIFVFLKFLKKFKLAGNKITKINPSWFEELTEMQEVSFDFDEDSSKDWLIRYPTLKFSSSNVVSLNGQESAEESTTENIETKVEEIPEIDCNFIEYLSPITNLMSTSCQIDSDVTFESERFKIKPSEEVSKVKRFYINGNKNVKYLPENMSEIFPGLEEVFVVNSGLLGVNKKTLNSLGSLKAINLSGNKIKHVEPDAFENLKSLEDLNLSDNNMEFIEEVLLHGPKNLKTVKLSTNKLHYIHPNTFRKLEDLEDIHLGNNVLSVIEPSTFKHNSKLRNVDLSENKLANIDPKTFARNKNLTNVNLSGNNCIDGIFDPQSFEEMKKKIKENCEQKAAHGTVVELTCEDDSCFMDDQVIDSSSYLIKSPDDVDGTQIKNLTFSGPNIKYLPNNIAKVFPSLEKLTTVDTSIVSLSKENFQDLKLVTLNLTGVESFETDTFGELSSLKNFYFNTDVEEIDDEAFSKFTQLETIYLITKRLRKLNPKIFEEMTELTDVEIDFEPSESEEEIKIEATLIQKNPKLKKLISNGNVVMNEGEDATTVESDIDNTIADEDKKQPETIPTKMPTKKPKATSRPKNHREKSFSTSTSRTPTTQNPLEKFVICHLSYANWPISDESLITCDLSDQSVDDPDTVIESTPYDSIVQALRVEGNKKFKVFPENMSKFKSLQAISVKNSSLEAIFPDDFAAMTSLKSLDLSDNNIETIEPDTFFDLSSLENLNLSGNDIEYLDEESFKNLKNLKTLDLKGNKINFVHPKTFENLPELTGWIKFSRNMF